MLPLTTDQMRRLRGQFGLYGTASGRIDIAGVSAHRIPYLAQGIVPALRRPYAFGGVGRHSRAAGEGQATGW